MKPGAGRVVRRGEIEGEPLLPRRYGGVPRRLLPRAAWRSLGTFCVQSRRNEFSITYDDGPHPVHTPRILDSLEAHGARATFFVLAQQARSHPDIVRRIVASGHELALHGPDHTSLLTLSTARARDAVAASRDAVEQIGQTAVALYRPPYGQHTFAQARAIGRLGLELAVWSSDARDWTDDTEENIADRAWRGVHPGAVLLLHDDRADPVPEGEAAPAFDRAAVLGLLLERLRTADFRSVAMSDLLGQGPRVRTIAWERRRP